MNKTLLFFILINTIIFSADQMATSHRTVGIDCCSTRTALITGVTGQDGSYLSEFLLERGYMVYGGIRHSSVSTTERINHIIINPLYKERFKLVSLDLLDQGNVIRVLNTIKPDEIYNLAAMSFVESSFKEPSSTFDVNAKGPLYLLEGIHLLGLKSKFYQASTSELYGLVQEIPQTEKTPFYPRSPYAIAKLAAYWTAINYRERGLFVCNGILFNHESPRRGENFVTRKITLGLARIKYGLQERLKLGNLNSLRDWGHSKDYVRMQWLMLQQENPIDYVIATGEQHKVRDFVLKAAQFMGIHLYFEGEGVNEVGKDENGKIWVSVSPEFFRPTEVETLIGDPSKAKNDLGWQPEISFEELVKEMALSDLKKAEKELMLKNLL
jgi:GDPmannose 4,6-dehydratase